MTPTNEAERGFDNDGNIIVKNRSYRRRKLKLPGSNIFTKKTMTKAERKKFRKLGRR